MILIRFLTLGPVFTSILASASLPSNSKHLVDTTPVNRHLQLSPRQTAEIRCDPDTPCSNGDCCNGETGFVQQDLISPGALICANSEFSVDVDQNTVTSLSVRPTAMQNQNAVFEQTNLTVL